ncbi:hypothetical protein ACTFIY_001263 [Dictyostelium cf. discoideum]
MEEAYTYFPGSLISLTKRGNVIGILNHNNKIITLTPIHLKEGRDIIAGMRIGTNTIRIQAIYAPAQPDKRNLMASQINEHYNKYYNNLNSTFQKIDIITGDFNCLDIYDSNPIMDYNFLSTSVIIENNQQSNWRRWRLKNSSILSNCMLQKIDNLLKRNYNGIKFSQLLSLLTKVKELYTNFQKQNDNNTKTNLKNLVSLLDTEYKDQTFAIPAINESKKRDESLKQELDNYCEDTSLRYISAKLK